MTGNEQVRAIDALVDLFVSFVLHVEGVIGLNAVDDDLLRKLDS
jgi:hypothetical protein